MTVGKFKIENDEGMGRGISMDESGKVRIQELVVGLAEGEGVDPKFLLFTWDKADLVQKEHGLKLDQKVLHLTVQLEKKTRVLSFSEHVVLTSVKNPEAFLSAYKDYAIAALRKLKKSDLEMRTL